MTILLKIHNSCISHDGFDSDAQTLSTTMFQILKKSSKKEFPRSPDRIEQIIFDNSGDAYGHYYYLKGLIQHGQGSCGSQRGAYQPL
jgi:hypothetical protein